MTAALQAQEDQANRAQTQLLEKSHPSPQREQHDMTDRDDDGDDGDDEEVRTDARPPNVDISCFPASCDNL